MSRERTEGKCFDPKTNAEIFKNFYSNLAEELVAKLPNAPNRFGSESVRQYYENISNDSKFNLSVVDNSIIQEILNKTKTNKAPGFDGLSGIFLKDGAEVLCNPTIELINLSIRTTKFTNKC